MLDAEARQLREQRPKLIGHGVSQCLSGRRIGDIGRLRDEIAAWAVDLKTRQQGVHGPMKVFDSRCELKSVCPRLNVSHSTSSIGKRPNSVEFGTISLRQDELVLHCFYVSGIAWTTIPMADRLDPREDSVFVLVFDRILHLCQNKRLFFALVRRFLDFRNALVAYVALASH